MNPKLTTPEELHDQPFVFVDAFGMPTCTIERIPTPDVELAKFARAAIHKEHDKRVESGSEFDVGFACGLSFALGAFSGVCEEKE